MENTSCEHVNVESKILQNFMDIFEEISGSKLEKIESDDIKIFIMHKYLVKQYIYMEMHGKDISKLMAKFKKLSSKYPSEILDIIISQIFEEGFSSKQSRAEIFENILIATDYIFN